MNCSARTARHHFGIAIAAITLGLADPATSALAQTVTGPLVQWQTLTIDFVGPLGDEASLEPSPFLDSRLQVSFTGPGGQQYIVPGFFDGDGTGDGVGSIYRVRFTPDQAGEWSYVASFRVGENVAIDLDAEAGTATGFDGAGGGFVVSPRDPDAPGVLKWGALEYAGGHYLKFADGPYWIKGGVDSPENWLGYSGFDNTPNAKHDFLPHVQDWNSGDPDWDSPDTAAPNDGRAIIGAINYLASVGANSIYFLPMNIGGDAKDSWPYVGPIDPTGDPSNDNFRYDISKLAQWEIFFQHVQRKGMQLHFVLNEAEAPNKLELDEATLGTERKLFYREMIARFGHHNAVQWNISEEYNLNLNLGAATVLEFAEYIRAVDPYDRPITVHNAGNPVSTLAPFFGQENIDLTSAQLFNNSQTLGQAVEAMRAGSAAQGKPIPVHIDEPESIKDVTFEQVRTRMLWDIYFSGGSVEWYNRSDDQTWEDFREAEQVWIETTIARTFMEENLPFWMMEPDDARTTGGSSFNAGAETFVLPGEIYAIYLPEATPAPSIDLADALGPLTLRWFNPRIGQFQGKAIALPIGSTVPIGLPPQDATSDWVALITLTNGTDCNKNGTPDDEDILNGTSLDCDNNGIPDECQTDCDDDGIPDACEPDCDGDGIPDACEPDCDGNGVPDDCDEDCDDDGLTDACELAAASGLVGTYFDGLEFQGERRARVDAIVNFDWGSGAPFPDWDGDTFSCRWTGWVRTERAGLYTFATVTNDGARLFVDGVQLVDQWQDQSPTEWQGQIELEGDTWYRIRMEHYEGQGTAVAELRWILPGDTGPSTIISPSRLAPALDLNGSGVPDICDPACVADFDNSGIVDSADLGVLLGAFGMDAAGDANGDGNTDTIDLGILLGAFGEECL